MKFGNSLLLFIGIVSSCSGVQPSSSGTQPSSNGNSQVSTPSISETIVENSVETWNILENTIYETPVYKFTSNVPGKKYAIVGGIHGDEVAGWKAALQLKERRDFIGEVLIIPQASILACKREERYPGLGSSLNGIKYKDLNRNFPGNSSGNATEKISNAITQTVIDFDADIIIDLHESRSSASSSFFEEGASSRLGDLLIYGNSWSSLFTKYVIQEYNASYLQDGDYPFGTDTYAPSGSFNQYFGKLYEEKIVFTIETTRYIDYAKKIPKNENRRIQQQLEIIDLVFKCSDKF